MKEYKYKKFAPFNDHTNCKQHGNFMLDSTLENETDREAVVMAINNYIEKENK